MMKNGRALRPISAPNTIFLSITSKDAKIGAKAITLPARSINLPTWLTTWVRCDN